MSLIKWVRKNERKVMAVVVILLMAGFIFQAFLTQCRQRRAAPRQTIAYFADNRKITNYDLALARRELEALKLLRMDVVLRGIVMPIFQTRDLQAIMLAGLLFPDRTASSMSIDHVKQMISANPYRVNERQINAVHMPSMPSEIYWILLKKEAQLAGMMISDETSRSQLEGTIPQIFNGAAYSQVINPIVNQQGISEEEILKAFGNMIEVLRYAELICTNENVTNAQIKHEISWEDETLNVEFVKFNSAVFAESIAEPKEEEVAGHFDKYKEFFEGDISDQNPYGFGYKLHDRVRLEYIAVKLDDVKKIVTAPTQEEVEEFYQRHREEFTEFIPSDLNDPNSQTIQRNKTYGEVASTIAQNLLNSRINSKAESIISEAKTLTELGLENVDTEPDEITAEQLRKVAGDYKIVADQISTKYKINVYAGRTELLDALDIITDNYLGAMVTKGYGYNPVPLIKIVFAVDDLNASELGPFEAPKPRLYENIGPAQDMRAQVMMLVRVTVAKKASAPKSINQTIASASLELGEEQQKKTSSGKEKVVKDLKKLSAMDITKTKAEKFIKLATKKGWENAVDKFNKLYAKPDEQTEQDSSAFELKNLTEIQRISDKELSTLAMKKQSIPTGWWLINEAEIESKLIDQLYSLVPSDSNTADTMPLALEFKPDMSYYCLKNISVNRLDQQQYSTVKAARVYKEDLLQSQSMAPIHFNPENVLKRMNFRLAKEDKESADVNMPAEAEGDL